MPRTLVSFAAVLALLFSILGNASPAIAQPAADQSTQTCTIVGSTHYWNPPGTMDVTVDGSDIGNFQFGPSGNTSLSFSCTSGSHSFTFAANFANGASASCSGSFSVGQNLNFAPQMNIGPNGTTCSL